MDREHPQGEALAAISNGLAHLHMLFYGRGPTRAKTHFVDDTIVCILWNGFTTVEETLIARDEADAVRAFRHAFQKAMKAQFVDIVEEAVGRHVVAYMSEVNVNPNVAVELFLLEPDGSRPPMPEAADSA
jgi:uncharacterized protein YbcI